MSSRTDPPTHTGRRLLVVWLVMALLGCGNPPVTPSPSPSPTAQPTINIVKPSLPPPDPDALEPGLGWAALYDVQLPQDAFPANPTPTPAGGTGRGSSGHPQHFPGQAVMADVVTTADGLIAVGYVGDPWTAIAWTSRDGFDWQLEQIETHDPSFAVGIAAGDGGTIVAVGRDGPNAAAWLRAADGRWGRVKVASPRGEVTRMTAVRPFGDGWVAGGSAGPETGERAARYWTSGDARVWKPVAPAPGFADAEVAELLESDVGLVALGRLGTGQRGVGTIVWTSADGAAWTRHEDAALRDSLAVAAVRWGDRYVAVGSDPDEREARTWTSTDGVTWRSAPAEESRQNFGNKIRMTDVVATPAGLLAVGNAVAVHFGQGHSWLSTDGISWTRSPVQPSLGQAEPLALALSDEYVVAVGERGAPDNRVPTVWLSRIAGR